MPENPYEPPVDIEEEAQPKRTAVPWSFGNYLAVALAVFAGFAIAYTMLAFR